VISGDLAVSERDQVRVASLDLQVARSLHLRVGSGRRRGRPREQAEVLDLDVVETADRHFDHAAAPTPAIGPAEDRS
jgi:hypothetical protein